MSSPCTKTSLQSVSNHVPICTRKLRYIDRLHFYILTTDRLVMRNCILQVASSGRRLTRRRVRFNRIGDIKSVLTHIEPLKAQ